MIPNKQRAFEYGAVNRHVFRETSNAVTIDGIFSILKKDIDFEMRENTTEEDARYIKSAALRRGVSEYEFAALLMMEEAAAADASIRGKLNTAYRQERAAAEACINDLQEDRSLCAICTRGMHHFPIDITVEWGEYVPLSFFFSLYQYAAFSIREPKPGKVQKWTEYKSPFGRGLPHVAGGTVQTFLKYHSPHDKTMSLICAMRARPIEYRPRRNQQTTPETPTKNEG